MSSNSKEFFVAFFGLAGISPNSHKSLVPTRADESLRTRTTLLNRVKSGQDEAGWEEFYRIYKRLILGLAFKAGLSQSEAEDVVQDTFLQLSQQLGQYDRARGSFKAWLGRLARWRIVDQLRRRQRCLPPRPADPTSTTGTDTVLRIPDPASLDLDALWEQEWENGLLQTAIEAVRRQADPEKFQMFDLYVNKEWPPRKVAAAFHVRISQVYLTKHRLTRMIKAEVKRLKRELR